MPIGSQGFVPRDITVQGAQNVKITNYNIAAADTEYSVALTSNLKDAIIRNRDISVTKVSFTSGESGTTYFTIPKGCTLQLSDLDFTGKTIYFQASDISTLEIMEFY